MLARADLLHRYVNVYLLSKGTIEATRRQTFITVKMFYRSKTEGWRSKG